ncbi:DEAD/DEAH box helicase family protein [Thermodesulfobacterium hydrogeniphilum]|uniref:DEAD/DEAH box helicase family protein n=1 Tax=Thermodesulfobacterium hydrogeniphilum TaxID=161156 RepID=UPI00056F244E|nr:DEAD/DEAH box helicase family protein [Thermodesulfobacterium hydrogeniphilum]
MEQKTHKTKIYLQEMIEDLRFENLSPNWISFDFKTFSKTKTLWDYQENALKNAIKVLWKYYEDFADYQKYEDPDIDKERKRKFYEWYKDNGLDLKIDLEFDEGSKLLKLLEDYYPVEEFSHRRNGKKKFRISYEHFINRMCFWMATGSGKTLVIVKLIQILRDLIKREEIPPNDILILTHRDDLIEQLKRHVNEFNHVNSHEIFIKLRELKEYDMVKREHPSIFREKEITVFYYRSDNLSDEQKDKIIDFKNYDNNGKWYIFLDEAHKGDKQESKRQHIYSILSRNGFLFNFSATFTDPRDVITTAFEFNLSSYVKGGYGKHILILEQEVRAFRDRKEKYEDYNSEEKQKIVLKSLILLTYVKKFYEKLSRHEFKLYHKPLLITLVNSVNIEDADLKLFFREIEKIGKGEINESILNSAINELWEELKKEPEFMFEEENLKIDEDTFKNIKFEDILKCVFNSSSTGGIEILIRPSDKKQMAFKLKTADKPFALIKIGDISKWLREEFSGYEINERFDDEGYFETLNRDDSDINILMGSRSFYEGWDSNRPNVIMFINIGTGADAKKFILQSVGRGVRIGPIKNKRKRIKFLYNNKEIDEGLYKKIKDFVLPLETLFIFGTNRNAIKAVIKELKTQAKKEGEELIGTLFTIADYAKNKKLLIPKYREVDYLLIKKREIAKFGISKEDFELLKRFIDFLDDDRILLLRYNTEPEKIKILKQSLQDKNKYYRIETNKSFRNVDLIIQRIFNYFSIVPEEVDRLKELENEIKHFKNIKVYIEEIDELKKEIEKVKNYPKLLKELTSQYGKIPPEEYIKKSQELKKEEIFEIDDKKIKIKYIMNHYYLPMVMTEEEKIQYITHIIKTKSEVRFIEHLEKYLSREDNIFKEFEWWVFSKINEHLDEVYIPYYSPNENKIAHFKPDFIFWLKPKNSNRYCILFIDPKGTEYRDADRKIEGYKEILEGKEFRYGNEFVKIFLFYYTRDTHRIPQNEYKKYWIDNIETALKNILNFS